MSLWGVHVGFAMLVTTLLLAHRDVSREKRWPLTGLAGLWAIVPDFHHLLSPSWGWWKPVLHDSVLSNLFWFHGLIDWLDPGDRAEYSLAMMVSFLLVFAAMEYRHWRA